MSWAATSAQALSLKEPLTKFLVGPLTAHFLLSQLLSWKTIFKKTIFQLKIKPESFRNTLLEVLFDENDKPFNFINDVADSGRSLRLILGANFIVRIEPTYVRCSYSFECKRI